MLGWIKCCNKKKKKEEIVDDLSYSWTLSAEELAERLGGVSLENGLTEEEVLRRQKQYGPNALKEKGGTKLWKIVFHHLVNIMSFVLFVAFVLAMVTQQWVDAGVVMGIIILNAIIGVSQEWKSEKTMEALKKMSSPNSFVIREGHPAGVKIPSSEIVPGDIVVISMGDKIPADMRLVSATDLECDESLLTGESTLVEKKVELVEGTDTPLGDRKNMVFMSSEVKMGKGMGIVIRTGQKTELGKIADSVGSAKKQTTGLEKRMNWMGIILAVVAAVAVGLVLLGLWVHDTEPLYPEGLQVGVTTAVALIPEALVPVITLGLTLGVRRMAKKKALVRKLAALEQLGNVTDICSDKTGTLTQNKMVATDMWLASDVFISVTGEGFDPTFGEFLIQEGGGDDDDDDDEGEDDLLEDEGDNSDEDESEDLSYDELEYETDKEGEGNSTNGGAQVTRKKKKKKKNKKKRTTHVVDKDGINTKPEYGELKKALLISSLCNASGIYKKKMDDSNNKKKKGWKKLLCCFFRDKDEGEDGGKEKGEGEEGMLGRGEEDEVEKAEEENRQLGVGSTDIEEGASLLHGEEDEAYTWTFKGTATEAALVTLSRKMGFDKYSLTRSPPKDSDDANEEHPNPPPTTDTPPSNNDNNNDSPSIADDFSAKGKEKNSSDSEEEASQKEEKEKTSKEENDNMKEEKKNQKKTPLWMERAEFPFDSAIKLMSVILLDVKEGRHVVFSKGAPERLLPKCPSYLSKDGKVLPLDEEETMTRIRQINDDMAHGGLRVLALAYKDEFHAADDVWGTVPHVFSNPSSEELPPRDEVESDLIFVGLVGIKDPPRPGVAEAVATCHKAGITVRMVTGDHPSTSAAIARQIGLINKREGEGDGLVMTSTQFDAMSDEELDQLDEIPLVIARCSPDSKVKMVELLHRNKKVTAMTGDGVNDSPAISIADVGIAMGQAGTEVTKEAADIILVDDDFSTIVSAIAEGRRIFANIRKFIVHLLAGNVAEAIVMVVGILSGLRPPIGPLQILWVNLVTGTPPAICLSVEKANKDLMDQDKRPIGENLFTTLTIVDIFYYGLVMGVLSLGAYIAMETQLAGHKEAQATCYVTLTSLLLVHAYNCRRLKKASMFSKSFITPRAWGFHASFLFGLGSVVFTLYTPGLNDTVFNQTDPGGWGWAICGIATFLFVFASEGYRMARKQFRKGLVKTRHMREARRIRRIKEKRKKLREAKPKQQQV